MAAKKHRYQFGIGGGRAFSITATAKDARAFALTIEGVKTISRCKYGQKKWQRWNPNKKEWV